MRWLSLVGLVALVGCVDVVEQGPVSQPAPQANSRPKATTPTRAQVNQFISVVQRVEPIAERECRARSPRANCDFRIVVDDRPGQPPNAYQTLDRDGQPILAFTLPLIAQVRNQDELAFVMGHEAAHHISGHIPRQQQNAAAGAILLGGLAAITGASQTIVDQAVDIGAGVGARSYSKNFELEADALGTVITHNAGYNPVRGAEFFSQLPDPGNRFLGTHPPNAQRVETVRRVAAGAAQSREAVDEFLKALKKDKKFARATHNTWAVLLGDGTPLKGDDGEAGAGQVILRMLERADLRDHVVVVTRWYGGKKLGGDRFRHVQDCARAYLDEMAI